MQSLGQAVYRYVCFHSREGRRGVRAEAIVQEMASRGYLEPLGERVRGALNESLKSVDGEVTGPQVVRINGHYFQKRAYLRLHNRR